MADGYMYIKKALKRVLNLDSHYPSMPEPTGWLGGPWSLAQQAYEVLTPVPEILTFRI